MFGGEGRGVVWQRKGGGGLVSSGGHLQFLRPFAIFVDRLAVWQRRGRVISVNDLVSDLALHLDQAEEGPRDFGLK